MASGYIRLHKQIQENCLWSDKPFARGQAWIDLLLMANFKDGQMMVKGVVVDIKRGQVFRTADYLAKRWGWSRGKVLRFLKTLENQKMATLTGLPNGTLITIENYNSYQLERTPDDTPDDTSSVQARYKVGTQKNKEKERINKNKEDIYGVITEAWNKLPVSNIKSIRPNTNRHKMLNARIKEYGIDAVLEAIENISESPFLLGRVNEFVITFDWFIKPGNFIKVYEGNYKEKKNDTYSGDSKRTKGRDGATGKLDGWNAKIGADEG